MNLLKVKRSCELYNPSESKTDPPNTPLWKEQENMKLSRDFSDHVGWSYIPLEHSIKYNYLMLLLGEDKKKLIFSKYFFKYFQCKGRMIRNLFLRKSSQIQTIIRIILVVNVIY